MTSNTSHKRRSRRMTREPQAEASTTKFGPRAPTRLDQLEGMLNRNEGASIAEMMKATGWQAHSVRGAMAGALKKRGLVITSDKIDGVRRYSASSNA